MKHQWLARRRIIVMVMVLMIGGLNFFPAGAQVGPTSAPDHPTNAPLQTPAVAQATPALTGKIAHITILGNKNVPADAIHANLSSKVGDPYISQATDKDLAALNGMGVFMSAATVNATADPAGGVDLAYTVSEYPVVTAIRFTADTPTGKPSVPTADLVAQMKTKIGQVLNSKTLTSDLDALFNHDTGYVAKQGRFADVGNNLSIDSKTGVVTIPLIVCRIQMIQITGNKRVKTADILARMHTKVGDVFDEHALGADMASVYALGGFKSIGNCNLTMTAPGKVTITIPVVEQAPATGILEEKRGKIIPFRYDPLTVPIPVIQVSVNGHPPLPFMVDTGTTAALSLDTWAAEELGLKPNGPTETMMGSVAFRRVLIRGVVLRGATRRDNVAFDTHEAQVLDLNFLRSNFSGLRLAGAVGLGMLLPVTSRFDFAARTLSLFTDPHPPLRVPGGTVLPLQANSTATFNVRVTLGPDTFADVMFDTGSTSTQIPQNVFGALHPTAITSSGQERLDGLYISPEVRLPGLRLGTLWVPDVVLRSMPPPSTSSLGLDILTGYRLTLDGPNGQLILEPSAQGKRYVTGWAGLKLKQTGSGWFLGEIKPGSPAGLSGLRLGDALVTVGGSSVPGLSRDEVERMLSGVIGTPVCVTVRRAGQMLTLSWMPQDKFHAPADAVDGLTMKQEPNGPWIILDVQKGCPADQAGLLPGDQITRMGGEPVAGMSQDRIEELLGLSPLPIEVVRAGQAQPLAMQLMDPLRVHVTQGHSSKQGSAAKP